MSPHPPPRPGRAGRPPAPGRSDKRDPARRDGYRKTGRKPGKGQLKTAGTTPLPDPLPGVRPPRILVLVGLMGVGKTTLGRLLARLYNLPFIDVDAEIERAAGCTVAEIFSRHGEAHFRAGEHRVIRRLLRSGPCVLATGGGAWMNPRTRQVIRATPGTCTIWLRAPLEVLLRRVLHKRAERPLLAEADPAETLKKLAAARAPFYAEADLTIDCGDESVEQGVTLIQQGLKNFAPLERLTVRLGDKPGDKPGEKESSYDILTGSGLLERARDLLVPHLKGAHAVIVTDETVAGLHLDTLLDGLKDAETPFGKLRIDVLTLPPGESSKTLAQYSRLMGQLLGLGIDRSTTLIALGGGVVGDLTGFMAATAMRGLPFIQIPTTLLAQVDSSVGGKTGVNLGSNEAGEAPEEAEDGRVAGGGKNLIGAFWQPVLVLADTSVLATLPKRQLKAGYAEIVKSAAIADPDLLAWCERHGRALLEGTPALLAEAVRRSCAFKARVVSADERESASADGRALLNLGHTFGHALEAEYGFDGRLLHGEAVSIGMVMALEMSVRLGLAPPQDLQRLVDHLRSLEMPVSLHDLPPLGERGERLEAEKLLEHMRRDKKARHGRLSFVLLRRLGEAFTSSEVEAGALYEYLCSKGCVPREGRTPRQRPVKPGKPGKPAPEL
ncbi:shikimate kinase [Oecophyllibacter saccharovorans]|uniref:shikimate kinase n=1 Tax=Oecophyllibacter saccharovorans TaxID=2558360 RepID=UPI00116CEF53|nr:shikimate kinase [Oecophyllibacter saccharovorans]TPW36665.1 shikimate kinase [Oecophyllibacter saccharovorans]